MNQNHVSEEVIERELEECVIKDRGSYDSGGFYLLFESGWSVQCPEEVYDRALPRTTIHRESYNSSTTGWLIDGEWISRKTDGEILQRKKSLKEAFARMNQDMLDENREYWQQLEADLPDWLKAKVEDYRSEAESDAGYKGNFELDYWGYIVIVAKLASLYEEVGVSIIGHNSLTLPDSLEPQAVREFARSEGATGAQHSLAIALVSQHIRDTAQTGDMLVTGYPRVADTSFTARFGTED